MAGLGKKGADGGCCPVAAFGQRSTQIVVYAGAPVRLGVPQEDDC